MMKDESQALIVMNQLKAINTVAISVSIADVEALITQINHEEAFGPFFDPTGWMRTHKTMRELKDVAQAFLTYRKALEKYK